MAEWLAKNEKRKIIKQLAVGKLIEPFDCLSIGEEVELVYCSPGFHRPILLL